ncbi:VanZ family protein [Pareuzebyella sediminis]|uniref:VanZ family protein n=1 Tax=Pareuzebyella sediminis TaxID=2607998 RepID=UPI0011EC8D5B|nr:VanZ family protein [Pareuzebyella sediminis]
MKQIKSGYLIGVLFILGILLILGLSWRSDPNLKGLPFMPLWIYSWADTYRFSAIRTAVPFLGLGTIIGFWLLIRKASFFQFVMAWAILIGVVTVAELGQYFIPSRDVDLKDIFWGGIGGFSGFAVNYVLLKLLRLFR